MTHDQVQEAHRRFMAQSIHCFPQPTLIPPRIDTMDLSLFTYKMDTSFHSIPHPIQEVTQLMNSSIIESFCKPPLENKVSKTDEEKFESFICNCGLLGIIIAIISYISPALLYCMEMISIFMSFTYSILSFGISYIPTISTIILSAYLLGVVGNMIDETDFSLSLSQKKDST